jgi:hypothetical protein
MCTYGGNVGLYLKSFRSSRFDSAHSDNGVIKPSLCYL